MSHDVFISYASEDKEVAERVCRALEEQDIPCWIAPRDIPFGVDYEEAIVDAISASPLLVLILSASSNRSPYVRREIQSACAENSATQIIPFRIEDIPYSKTLRFYLGSTQWLDAYADSHPATNLLAAAGAERQPPAADCRVAAANADADARPE
jgi:hypothetical protein